VSSSEKGDFPKSRVKSDHCQLRKCKLRPNDPAVPRGTLNHHRGGRLASLLLGAKLIGVELTPESADRGKTARPSQKLKQAIEDICELNHELLRLYHRPHHERALPAQPPSTRNRTSVRVDPHRGHAGGASPTILAVTPRSARLAPSYRSRNSPEPGRPVEVAPCACRWRSDRPAGWTGTGRADRSCTAAGGEGGSYLSVARRVPQLRAGRFRETFRQLGRWRAHSDGSDG
jgi:hypothetical protein